MDWATIIVSAILSVGLQTVIIVELYNRYIIPKIVVKVKDQLMVSIDAWVADLKGSFADTIRAEMRSLKLSVAGKVGRNTQLMKAAQSYLEEELGEDGGEDLEEDVYANIVNSAIAQYGGPLVNAALKAITEKNADKSTEQQGW